MSDPENSTKAAENTKNGPPSASATTTNNHDAEAVIQNGNKADSEGSCHDSDKDDPKEVVATKVTGTVKWFNVKSGYGFINRNDTKEDVFVHQTAIARNNPKKAVRSVGDGELVEFDVVVGEKGNEASNVSGPEGGPVKGSPYAADRRRGTGGLRRPGGRYTRGAARSQRPEPAGPADAESPPAPAPAPRNNNKYQQEKPAPAEDAREPAGHASGRGRPAFKSYRPRYIRRGGPPRAQGGYVKEEVVDHGEESNGGGRGRSNRDRPMRGGGGFRGGRGGGPPTRGYRSYPPRGMYRGGRGGSSNYRARGGRSRGRGYGGYRGHSNGESTV